MDLNSEASDNERAAGSGKMPSVVKAPSIEGMEEGGVASIRPSGEGRSREGASVEKASSGTSVKASHSASSVSVKADEATPAADEDASAAAPAADEDAPAAAPAADEDAPAADEDAPAAEADVAEDPAGNPDLHYPSVASGSSSSSRGPPPRVVQLGGGGGPRRHSTASSSVATVENAKFASSSSSNNPLGGPPRPPRDDPEESFTRVRLGLRKNAGSSYGVIHLHRKPPPPPPGPPPPEAEGPPGEREQGTFMFYQENKDSSEEEPSCFDKAAAERTAGSVVPDAGGVEVVPDGGSARRRIRSSSNKRRPSASSSGPSIGGASSSSKLMKGRPSRPAPAPPTTTASSRDPPSHPTITSSPQQQPPLLFFHDPDFPLETAKAPPDEPLLPILPTIGDDNAARSEFDRTFPLPEDPRTLVQQQTDMIALCHEYFFGPFPRVRQRDDEEKRFFRAAAELLDPVTGLPDHSDETPDLEQEVLTDTTDGMNMATETDHEAEFLTTAIPEPPKEYATTAVQADDYVTWKKILVEVIREEDADEEVERGIPTWSLVQQNTCCGRDFMYYSRKYTSRGFRRGVGGGGKGL